MTSDKIPAERREPQRSEQDLDRRYGAIGISAVAAAVRYSDGPVAAGKRRDDSEPRYRSDRVA